MLRIEPLRIQIFNSSFTTLLVLIVNNVECFLVLFCNLQKGVKKSSLRFQRTNRSRTLNLKDKVTVLATSVQITVKAIDLLSFSYGVHMYAQVITTSICCMNSRRVIGNNLQCSHQAAALRDSCKKKLTQTQTQPQPKHLSQRAKSSVENNNNKQ